MSESKNPISPELLKEKTKTAWKDGYIIALEKVIYEIEMLQQFVKNNFRSEVLSDGAQAALNSIKIRVNDFINQFEEPK